MAFKMNGWSPYTNKDLKKAGDVYDNAFSVDASKFDYKKLKNVDFSKGLGYKYGKEGGPVHIAAQNYVENKENVKKKFSGDIKKPKKQTVVKPKSKKKTTGLNTWKPNYTYQDFINKQWNPKITKPVVKPPKNKRSLWAKDDIQPQTTMEGGKTGKITKLDIKAYGKTGKPQTQRHKK